MDMTAFRNLRPGDILWIQVHPGQETEVGTIQEAVLPMLGEGVRVLVTPSDVVQRIKLMPLSDLCAMQEVTEQMIRARLQGQVHQAEG